MILLTVFCVRLAPVLLALMTGDLMAINKVTPQAPCVPTTDEQKDGPLKAGAKIAGPVGSLAPAVTPFAGPAAGATGAVAIAGTAAAAGLTAIDKAKGGDTAGAIQAGSGAVRTIEAHNEQVAKNAKAPAKKQA